MNFIRKGLGLKEEVYGPSAIRTVGTQTTETPYTVTTKADHKWQQLDETNVETKTFYAFTDDGRIAMFQVVYSSLLGMRKTGTVNVKLFNEETGKSHVWDTDELKSWSFSEDGFNFKGDYSSADLSDDGTSYTLHTKNDRVGVAADLVFTQAAPGFKVGADGTSYYGTDPAKPWGRMTHHFWPRCTVSGTITGNGATTNINGIGMFAYALQGMKPHFAARKWNFFTFQGPTYSAILMEFTTPPSYGETVVAVGGLAKNGELLITGASPTASVTHTETKVDKASKMPEPVQATYTIAGAPAGASAVVAGTVGPRLDMIDIMGELPGAIKSIAVGVSGVRPYIFQYGGHPTIKISLNGEQLEEQGRSFAEATFIS